MSGPKLNQCQTCKTTQQLIEIYCKTAPIKCLGFNGYVRFDSKIASDLNYYLTNNQITIYMESNIIKKYIYLNKDFALFLLMLVK